jgi:hypothetical protein
VAVKCPKCHFENPDTLKFCGECGTQLIREHKPDSPEFGIASPYSKTETLQTAIRELTTGTGVSDSFFLFLGRSLVDFKIAKIYEQMGDKIKARERYQKFLELMKNADSRIPEVDDAKKRLAGLKS